MRLRGHDAHGYSQEISRVEAQAKGSAYLYTKTVSQAELTKANIELHLSLPAPIGEAELLDQALVRCLDAEV
jgi:hypothetical protein